MIPGNIGKEHVIIHGSFRSPKFRLPRNVLYTENVI